MPAGTVEVVEVTEEEVVSAWVEVMLEWDFAPLRAGCLPVPTSREIREAVARYNRN
jgi:hypothetical protein